jgi:hypothetical protein
VRLIAIATLVVVAGIAIGAASRPHAVNVTLTAAQSNDDVGALALLVLAGAIGLLLGATRYPMWVRGPKSAASIPGTKSRLPWGVRAMLMLLPLAVLAFAIATASRLSAGGQAPASLQRPGPVIPAGTGASGGAGNLILACLVVALTAGLAAAVLFRKAPPARYVPTIAPQDAAAEILDEGLEAMLAEHDPRKAVIAAYVAMERAMARRGWPRRPHEAPTEYLARVLGVAPSRAEDLDELVRLYELARFSLHTVTASMRDAAVDAVRRLRTEPQEPT